MINHFRIRETMVRFHLSAFKEQYCNSGAYLTEDELVSVQVRPAP